MGRSLVTALLLIIVVPHAAPARKGAEAERAWRPFFKSFREAVRGRDREALKKMMARDFYFSAGGGDDNRDGDTRDEAFEFWDNPNVRGWQALDRVLARGTAPATRQWTRGWGRRFVGRVAPPAANARRSVERGLVGWYALFEFRDGRWYCVMFNQCCD